MGDGNSDLRELVRSSSTGDRAALDELLVRFLPRARAFVRVQLDPQMRLLESAEDIVQSACREILAKPERFEFRDERAFVNWFCTAALMKVRDRRRHHLAAKRDVRLRVAQDAATALLAQGYSSMVSPSGVAMGREFTQRMEAILDQLDATKREVLMRACLLEETHDEIAAALGITAVNSRSILARARAEVARRLAQADPD